MTLFRPRTLQGREGGGLRKGGRIEGTWEDIPTSICRWYAVSRKELALMKVSHAEFAMWGRRFGQSFLFVNRRMFWFLVTRKSV